MERKFKILIGAGILLAVLIAGILVYFNVKEKPGESKVYTNSLSANNVFNNLNMTDSQKLYSAIEGLNETNCYNLNTEYKSKCLDSISFVKNADNPDSCFNKSISVESMIRYICIKNLRRTN